MGQIFVAILLILQVLCSFLLISVILLQKSKGGGLGGTAFGGGGGDSLFGARTGTVLTKITITLSIFFLANTLVLAFVYAGPRDRSLMDSRRSVPIVPIEPATDLPPAAVPSPIPVGADMMESIPFETLLDPAALEELSLDLESAIGIESEVTDIEPVPAPEPVLEDAEPVLPEEAAVLDADLEADVDTEWE